CTTCSTVFPYTTLFRSRRVDVLPAVLALGRHLVGDERRALRVHEWAGGRIRDGDADRLARVGVVELHRGVEPVAAILFDHLRGPDRKSTRLNSSHVKNS